MGDEMIYTSDYPQSKNIMPIKLTFVVILILITLLLSDLFLDQNIWSSALGAKTEALSLEGKWILINQRYGQGNANLANIEKPVYLEFTYIGSQLHGKIWAESDQSETLTEALSWPAFVNDNGLVPVEVIKIVIDNISGTAYAHYRVKPSSNDDLILDILEQYQITEQGKALKGEMKVSLKQGETNRGSFVLHRRFERKDQ